LFRHPAKLGQALSLRTSLVATPYRTGCWPLRADGRERVEQATLTDGRRTWTVPCDYLACAFGLVPNIELPALLGCSITGGFVAVDDRQQTIVPNVYAAGELTGIGGAEAALVEGQLAGAASAGIWDRVDRALFTQRAAWKHFTSALAQTFELR